MSQNNVVQFPLDRVAHPARATINALRPPEAVAEIKDVYYLLKARKAEEIVQVLLPLIAQGFMAYGITLNDKINSRNVALMLESIRSAVHGYLGLEHPLQPLAGNLFIEHEGKIILKPLHVSTANSSNSA